MCGLRFRWLSGRFVAQLSFGSKPILNIFSVLPAALGIQLKSAAGDLFFGSFFALHHGNSLVVGTEAALPPHVTLRYFPFPVTVMSKT